MADLPHDFWSGWVIVLSVTGFACLLWLVISVYFLSGGNEETPEHEPVWDNDLREGNSPAPLWWFWLILAAMVFSVLYLILYPGLGSYAGAFHWSQEEQLHEHQTLADLEFMQNREALAAMSLDELAADPTAMEAAHRLFMDNCAACHGSEAQGQANLFPNLRDDDWLWGGSPAQIEQTIRNGRTAVMIAWQAVLGEAGVANVADYVRQLHTGSADDLPGKAQYQQLCMACHGMDGAGNQMLGAPRLNDDIWLYGGDEASVRTTISKGRNGQMPAFGEKLDDLQIKLLIAWLLR